MDAPDPSIASEARLKSLTFPVFGLAPQRELTRTPISSFSETGVPAAPSMVWVAFTYTLWRYPDDRSDPRNEVELDERTRRAIEEEPPWGRPAWLVEQAQIFRYPMLWEAVRTTWEATPGQSLSEHLRAHADHVLRNSFREELGLPAGPTRRDDWKIRPAAVTDAVISVDGEDRAGLRIDTDPFITAVAFRVDDHVVCTSVVPRDSLEFFAWELSPLG